MFVVRKVELDFSYMVQERGHEQRDVSLNYLSCGYAVQVMK